MTVKELLLRMDVGCYVVFAHDPDAVLKKSEAIAQYDDREVVTYFPEGSRLHIQIR